MAQLSRPFSLDEYALIVEHVVENWQSHPTLRALCLTQRSLVHLCQKRIFSSITCSSQQLDTFPDIVSTSPHLFDYIRDFYYELDDSDQPISVKTRRNENTIQFFERLHDLHFLSVSALESEEEVYWEVIDPLVSDALLRLILSPCLRSLLLRKIRHFPPNGLLGLRNSRHLETISLTGVVVGLLEVEDIFESMDIGILLESDSPAPQPSKFSACANSGEAVMTLVGGPHDDAFALDYPPVLDFTRLRNIYAESDNILDSIGNHLLIKSASQLEDLSYVLTRESSATFEDLAEPILNGPFQTLRTLKLSTMSPEQNDSDPFLESVSELKQLAGGKMKCLESIDMHFNIYTSNSTNGPIRLCQAINAGCKSIDGIFAGRVDAFPALRSISIYFLISIFKEPRLSNFDREWPFNSVSQQIKQQSFKNLDAIPTINNSFRLEMKWTDEE